MTFPTQFGPVTSNLSVSSVGSSGELDPVVTSWGPFYTPNVSEAQVDIDDTKNTPVPQAANVGAFGPLSVPKAPQRILRKGAVAAIY